jgi:hypothetical protein
MLLAMIKEIDKICPEEGLPNAQAVDYQPMMDNHSLTPE